MKKYLLSTPVFAVLLASAIALCSFTIAVEKANFSGDWKLNESKSELGEFGARMAATALKVEQKDDAISITKTSPGFNGGDPVTTTLKLSYDGKVTESEGFGGSIRKSTAKWSDDQTLVIDNLTNIERNGQTMEIKSKETWTLKDGILTIVVNSSSPRGESTIKTVYTK